MAPTGGVPGRTGPDDATAQAPPAAQAPAEPVAGVDRATLLAEAVTLWELQDEIALHVLGLDQDGDDVIRSPHEFVRAVSEQVSGGDVNALAAAGTITTVRPARERLPSGSRVEYWRTRRGLTQHDVARRVGSSSTWVAAVENGLDRIPTIDSARRIATALQVDLPLLLGRDPQPQPLSPDDPLGVDIERVREFLEHTDAMGPDPRTAVPSLAAIALTLREAWQTYGHADYGHLMRALPQLLQDAATSDGIRTGGHDGPEAARLLGQTYQLTAVVLRKLGEYHLSWLTADRAIEAARRGQDPLLAAGASRAVSASLLALGRTTAALNLTTTATRALPATGRPDHTLLVIRGSLLLQSAAAAARMGDAATTRDLLFSADIVAARLGRDADRYWTRFGPTSVGLSRASTAVDLGEGAHAVSVHQRLPQIRLDSLPREQRAGHYLTLARAYLQVGATDQAARAWEISARLAPGELRSPLHQAIHLQIRAA
jgi:transcriptional regulator with XRE-family HTH domain